MAKDQLLRAKLVSEAIVELTQLGPYKFSVGDVCVRVGVTQAMANYYFGGRWGLIEVAVLDAYSKYVDQMIAAANSEVDPIERLTAWASAQVEWTSRSPGIAVILNFQNLVPGIEGLDSGVRSQLAALGQRHVNFVTGLVRDAKVVSGYREINDTQVRIKTGVFMWTILGMSTWYSGRHIPTSGMYGDVLPIGLIGIRSLISDWLLNPSTTDLELASADKTHR